MAWARIQLNLYCTHLGCELQKVTEDGYQVTLPSWRLDLEREIDLIEEIARVYGYNRFANTLPTFAGIVVETPDASKEAVVRRTLLALGWNEALSSSFCSATDAVTFAPQPGLAVAMGNPLNEEAGMLRPSLLPGMLTMLAHNLNRNVNDIQLFEKGTVFSGSPESVDELTVLSHWRLRFGVEWAGLASACPRFLRSQGHGGRTDREICSSLCSLRHLCRRRRNYSAVASSLAVALHALSPTA